MNKGYFFIFLTAFLFGTMETALKFFGNLFHPIQITVLRFFVGGVFLLPMAINSIRKRGEVFDRKAAWFFVKDGFVGVFVSMIFYQMAIVYGKAGINGVLFSCNPVFVAFWAHFLLHDEIDKFTIVSIIFSLFGILAIIDPTNLAGTGVSSVLIMLSAVTFALYGVMGRPWGQRYGGVAVTSFSFLTGAAELYLFFLLTKVPAVREFLLAHGLGVFTDIPMLENLTWNHLPGFLYIAFAVTSVGYASYAVAIEYTNPVTASLAFFVKPILATFFAYLIMGEEVKINMVIGIILILIGSSINLYPKFKAASAAKKKE